MVVTVVGVTPRKGVAVTVCHPMGAAPRWLLPFPTEGEEGMVSKPRRATLFLGSLTREAVFLPCRCRRLPMGLVLEEGQGGVRRVQRQRIPAHTKKSIKNQFFFGGGSGVFFFW